MIDESTRNTRAVSLLRGGLIGVACVGIVSVASAIAFQPPASPAAGAAVGEQFNATDSPAGFQSRHSIAVDGVGNSVAVWEETASLGSDWVIKGRCFDSAGVPMASAFQISDTTASGTNSSGAQRFPSVARNSAGAFIVTWEDFNGSGTSFGHRISARWYNSSCAAASSAYTVYSGGGSEEHAPAVSLDSTGVAWIWWYDAGKFTGQNYVLNTTSFTNTQTINPGLSVGATALAQVAVGADGGGNIVVAFAANAGGTSADDVYAQPFAQNGTAFSSVGTPVMSNTTTLGNQDAPAISVNANGDVVVAWQSVATGKEIAAQRYHLTNTGGTQTMAAVGTELTVVPSGLSSAQFVPTVAMDYAGRFWTTWQGKDTSAGILASWFNGSAFDAAATHVSPVDSDPRVLPVAAADTDGDLLLAWTDQGSDSAVDDVYVRRLAGHESVDLSISTSDAPLPAVSNNSFTYTLTVTNNHALSMNAGVNDPSIGTATGVVVTDVLPTNATYVSASGTNWSCANATGVVTCKYSGPLAPQGTASLNVMVTLPTVTSGTDTVTNKPSVSAMQYDSSTGNNSVTDAQSVAPVSDTLSSSASSVSFADTDVGNTNSAGTPSSVTLTNTGNSSITFSANAFSASGTNATDFGIVSGTDTCSGKTLAVSGTCAVSFNFTPSASGSRSGTETVNTTQTLSSAVTLGLSGNGLGATATLSPSSLTFSNQAMGTGSATQLVTLTNNGNASLTLTSVAVSSGFFRSSDCTAIITAGSSCSINVSFFPTTAGPYNGQVSVFSSAPEGVDTVGLTGTVIQLPAAPAGLSAAPGNGQVGLNWTPVSGATSYNIYTGTGSGAEGGAPVSVSGGNSSGVTVTGLTNGTKYFFVVQAVNASGHGGNSNEANATPVLPVPVAPTGVSAVPGNASVTLSWTASSLATGYSVYAGTASGAEAPPVVLSVSGGSSTGGVVTGLANGTKYYFVVQATNSSGHSSNSNEASSTPVLPVPAAPTGLSASAGDTTATLSWTAVSGATGYNIYQATCAGCEAAPVALNVAGGGSTTTTITGLTDGTKYFYVIQAVNSTGHSASSNEATARPQIALPAAPTLSATAGDTTVTLNWNAVAGATSYNIYQATCSGCEAAPVALNVAGGGSTTTTVNGLTAGTKYYFVIQGINSSGHSPSSNEANATPN